MLVFHYFLSYPFFLYDSFSSSKFWEVKIKIMCSPQTISLSFWVKWYLSAFVLQHVLIGDVLFFSPFSFRETSAIKVNDISSKIASSVGAAVEATNKLPIGSRSLLFGYNRRNPKRRCLMEPVSGVSRLDRPFNVPGMRSSKIASTAQEIGTEGGNEMFTEKSKVSVDSEEGLASLSNMIAVLCEQHLFLPLLRAFEMFLPSCSLLPFIRSLQVSDHE